MCLYKNEICLKTSQVGQKSYLFFFSLNIFSACVSYSSFTKKLFYSILAACHLYLCCFCFCILQSVSTSLTDLFGFCFFLYSVIYFYVLAQVRLHFHLSIFSIIATTLRWRSGWSTYLQSICDRFVRLSFFFCVINRGGIVNVFIVRLSYADDE